MEDFLQLSHGDLTETLIPGALRTRLVKVGQHTAPAAEVLDSMMNTFEHLYSKSAQARNATRVVYMMASNHFF